MANICRIFSFGDVQKEVHLINVKRFRIWRRYSRERAPQSLDHRSPGSDFRSHADSFAEVRVELDILCGGEARNEESRAVLLTPNGGDGGSVCVHRQISEGKISDTSTLTEGRHDSSLSIFVKIYFTIYTPLLCAEVNKRSTFQPPF